ncbi:MAG: C40 family peptidase [Rubrivivax sp.]|nr:C40 family peptidase [Rubrivivax sp.]
MQPKALPRCPIRGGIPAEGRLAAALLAVALLAGCGSTPPRQPQAEADPLQRLLVERGLAPDDAATATADGAQVVVAAINFLELPYRRGGSSADLGFDCSGFTQHVYALTLGLALPRRADQQATGAGLLTVTRDELLPGDLVFFNTLRRSYSHVGIYVGGGRFIHAPRTGAEIRIESLQVAYWSSRFDGARRAPATVAAAAAAGANALR